MHNEPGPIRIQLYCKKDIMPHNVIHDSKLIYLVIKALWYGLLSGEMEVIYRCNKSKTIKVLLHRAYYCYFRWLPFPNYLTLHVYSKVHED